MSKTGFMSIVGVVGGAIATLFGGWDTGLITLCCFMAADYMSGMLIAFVWHKSPKTENGGVSSDAGLKGLLKKGMMLLMVLVAVRLDMLIGIDYTRDAVVIALCVNELVSLVENWGLMGLPVPAALARAIELLKTKEDKKDGI